MLAATLSRRRFIAISAAAAGAAGRPAGAQAQILHWRGTVLGADATILIDGVDEATGRPIVAEVEAELDRLERIFSLYRRGSAVRRLNGAGEIANPAPEMVDVLRLAGRVHAVTGGAFDPTVQPIWALHANAAAEARRPEAAELAEAMGRTGWRGLRISAERISFARPGMAITLNGIAQGYLADRIAALLRARGLRNVLVDTGEIAAIGNRPDGAPWRAAIALPDGGVLRRLTLSDRALATSAPQGTLVNPAAGTGHILDPKTGGPAAEWRLIAVSADSAALADALSTAFCLMSRAAIERALADFPDAALESAA